MQKLSKEAFEFRGRLLNEGGNLQKVLVECLRMDLNATNALVQTLYDEYGGELTFMSALVLANGCKWIMQGKPDTLEEFETISISKVKAALQAEAAI